MLILVSVNCTIKWTTVLTTTSSSDSSLNVTRSWQNDRETTSSTSHWTNTTAAAVDNSTSYEDDNSTTAMLTTSEPSASSFWQYQASINWMSTCAPILMVVAIVGNTLSLITLQNPTLHHEFHNKHMVLDMTPSVIQLWLGRLLRHLLAQRWEESFCGFETETNAPVAPEPAVPQVVDQLHPGRVGIFWRRHGHRYNAAIVALISFRYWYQEDNIIRMQVPPLAHVLLTRRTWYFDWTSVARAVW